MNFDYVSSNVTTNNLLLPSRPSINPPLAVNLAVNLPRSFCPSQLQILTKWLLWPTTWKSPLPSVDFQTPPIGLWPLRYSEYSFLEHSWIGEEALWPGYYYFLVLLWFCISIRDLVPVPPPIPGFILFPLPTFKCKLKGRPRAGICCFLKPSSQFSLTPPSLFFLIFSIFLAAE